MSLQKALEKPAEDFRGVLGVSVKHLGTGESAHLNGDMLFPTASVFKLPIIVEFFRQVEKGKLSLDQKITLRDVDKVPGSGILKELSEGLDVSLRDLLSLMMIISDNTATDLVAARVGFTNVNVALQSLGLTKTSVTRYCREILFDLVGVNMPLKDMTLSLFEKNQEAPKGNPSWSLGVEGNDVTTPNEMNTLLELVATGKAASKESCDQILGIMGRCQTGPSRIPKYLPANEVKLERKTGSLPGIRNDVGVVTIKATGERYALSCFTMDAEDVYAAEEAIAQVSLNVYNYFKARQPHP
jgi:beta-lactamase class A